MPSQAIDFERLSQMSLFDEVTPEQVQCMVECLNVQPRSYDKGEYLCHVGQVVKALGVVLKGSVRIENNDVWGNTTVLSVVEEGSIFVESYAAMTDEPLLVNVVAAQDCEVLFLDTIRICSTCERRCPWHTTVNRNLLGIIAAKNVGLTRRITHSAPRTIRGKLLSYLSTQALKHGGNEFTIPYTRQQLADYLCVDRSALCTELGKMQKEGLLETRRSHFVLSKSFAEAL